MKASLDRLAERAGAEGLLDVAYATVDSPFGPLLLAATPRGLVRVNLPTYDPEETLEELAARISPRVLEAPARLDEARRELDLYFEGKLTEFDLPIDWQLTDGFRRRSSGRSTASPTARPAPTRRWRAAPATSVRCAPPAPPAAPTRSRSSSPATGCCALAAASAATAAAWR